MKIQYAPRLTEKEILGNVFALNFAKFSYYEKIVHDFSVPTYESWEKVQYLSPFSAFSRKEEGYSIFHFFRKQQSVEILFTQKNKVPFFLQELVQHKRFFHEFSSGFYIHESGENTPESEKQLKRRILRGFEEEAIASSLLEGANTTRAKAMEMIALKKEPKNEGEKMVMNNFNTILWIESEAKNEAMSVDLLCKIQEKLTKGTLENETQSGRFRTTAEDIRVKTPGEKTVHIPPDEKKMKKDVELLITFANNKEGDKYFFTPILKAIILHFMIGYIHPFCDGNGRTARAIFYWYLLKHKFENIGFLPISTEIMKNRTLYDKSFIYTEQENGNITYSVDMMVTLLKKSIVSFHEYIEKESQKIEEKKILQEKYYNFNLNQRQIDLIIYFKQYPEDYTDFNRHKTLQNISNITARKDLLDLEKKEFLQSKIISNKRIFHPTNFLFNI